jgi:hypothetical protein
MTDRGWLGLGLLFRRGYIKDPQAFYCPDQRFPAYAYPDAWSDAVKRIGYLYRVFDQAVSPHVSAQETIKTMNLRLGRFKGKIALASDICYAWPHQPRPWGVNVAWSDGSGSFVQLTKYDYDVSARANYAAVQGGYDLYCYFFWRALETDNWRNFAAMVDALQWANLRAQYPPL